MVAAMNGPDHVLLGPAVLLARSGDNPLPLRLAGDIFSRIRGRADYAAPDTCHGTAVIKSFKCRWRICADRLCVALSVTVAFCTPDWLQETAIAEPPMTWAAFRSTPKQWIPASSKRGLMPGTHQTAAAVRTRELELGATRLNQNGV